ncbi:Hsp20/alpha crystallin family protein, partial [Geminocystis sp. GBBB08]|uniref:Hsp20/alpha crystallin family protein n=1 Tax=Geminocystis sp. GBBB08 TaxID=2604140 RepID=UPI0027E2CFA2
LKPSIELLDNQDSLTLRVLVPGIDKKDLDISVTREAVKISGEYRHQEKSQDNGYYVSEFNYGKFERTINLPVAVQNDQVSADYKDGILSLNLPKIEEVKNKVFKVSLGEENQPTLEASTDQ